MSKPELELGHRIHCRLDELLEERGMTLTELAERVGVTRQTVIAIEQGRYSPSLEMAFRIAHALGVPLDEVFQYPDPEQEQP